VSTGELDEPASGHGRVTEPRAGWLLLEALLRTLALYGFAGWGYIALNAVVHPETLKLPLTHLADWPREDTFGVICFAVSMVSFFGVQFLRLRRVPPPGTS